MYLDLRFFSLYQDERSLINEGICLQKGFLSAKRLQHEVPTHGVTDE